jgi:RHS repeat-associated protein
VRLVNAAGTKVVDYTYDPYGNTSADAAVGNPFQYAGRENDVNSFYYYRARYYSPVLARFISSDPIGISGGINTYAYVGGNPLTRVDPFGLDWFRLWNDQSSQYVAGREVVEYAYDPYGNTTADATVSNPFHAIQAYKSSTLLPTWQNCTRLGCGVGSCRRTGRTD